MATTPTKHPVSHWEEKFNAALIAICAAFWSRIESRQQQLQLTSTATGDVPNGDPVLMMEVLSISCPQPYGAACRAGTLQNSSPTNALAQTPTWTRRGEKMMSRNIHPHKLGDRDPHVDGEKCQDFPLPHSVPWEHAWKRYLPSAPGNQHSQRCLPKRSKPMLPRSKLKGKISRPHHTPLYIRVMANHSGTPGPKTEGDQTSACILLTLRKQPRHHATPHGTVSSPKSGNDMGKLAPVWDQRSGLLVWITGTFLNCGGRRLNLGVG
ncbi:Hypothetical predicted protein [Pelobates cultripes]|uniref:Uncharacterized protein n=1 Tax=Pelobates cultripes TaxID=61616 RepID=A0AAD1W2D7_PELCU|nr:Hypothetical predicted protein [Pelobates cultripes]